MGTVAEIFGLETAFYIVAALLSLCFAAAILCLRGKGSVLGPLRAPGPA